MNRRGGAYVLLSILDLLFVGLMLAVSFFILSGLVTSDVESQRTEAEVAFNRMYYSPNAFSFTDEAGITIPGLIDIDKFNNVRLEEAFVQESKYIGAEFKLTFSGTEKTIYLNPRTYTLLAPMAEAGLKKGGSLIDKDIPITVRYQGKYVPGYLHARVVSSQD